MTASFAHTEAVGGDVALNHGLREKMGRRGEKQEEQKRSGR